jgi:CheY-like chemotaxis protein
MMPGVDGYAVCRSLKADPATRSIPVIFLTASADRALNRQAFDTRCGQILAWLQREIEALRFEKAH